MEKLVDVYLEWDMPSYEAFEDHLTVAFDYELFTQVRGNVSRICDAKKEVDQIIGHMYKFVDNLKGQPRKEQALAIIQAYGDTPKKGLAFVILEGKEVNKRWMKTLLLQVLGKI